MRSGPMISLAPQYYSNHGGQLRRPHPDITPVSVQNAWKCVDGKRTGTRGAYKRNLLTPFRFEIIQKNQKSIGKHLTRGELCGYM